MSGIFFDSAPASDDPAAEEGVDFFELLEVAEECAPDKKKTAGDKHNGKSNSKQHTKNSHDSIYGMLECISILFLVAAGS